MKTKFIYKPFNKFIYRVPAYPLCYLESLFNQNFKFNFDKFIMESIYLASPILYEELKKIKDAGDEIQKVSERVINSYVRYISRMSTRCTPFGLFASCSVGEIGTESSFFVSDVFKRATRLDMFYLCVLSQAISTLPDIKKQLRYYPNNTLYKSGNKWRYIEYKYLSERRIHSVMSVQSTRVLTQILQKAKEGVKIDQLVQLMMKQSFEKESAEIFVCDLIESQVLVGELDVSVVGEPYLSRLINVLGSMSLDKESASYFQTLNEIDRKLNEMDTRKINNVNAYKNIVSDVSKLPVIFKDNYLFQVDMSNGSSNMKLGEHIIKELKTVLSYLLKKMTFTKNQLLRDFQDAFYRRYEDREVPLSLALDPDLGIGYPVSYGEADSSPLINELMLPYERIMPSSQDSIHSFLLKLLVENNDVQEILLPLEDIFEEKDMLEKLPSTLFVIFQIIKDTEKELLLNIKGVSCGSPANLISRFANLDEDIADFVTEIITKEKEQYANEILAEIVHLPNSRIGNIVSRPHMRDYEIVYISDSDRSDSEKIQISDLMLSCRNGNLILSSKRLNKVVCPKLTNAHNYHNDTLPVYHFLCDMQYQNQTPGFDFNWGKLDSLLEYRPRVKYGNSILSLASWKVLQQEIHEFVKLENEQLIAEFTLWREIRHIPQYVLLVDGDNELLVDFNSSLSIKSMLSIVKNRQAFILTEFIFEDKDLVIKSTEGGRLNECIVAFYRS